jgi:hypothetical protein
MLAWYWRRRSARIPDAGWAFLGPDSGVLPRQELRPGLAVGMGLAAGFFYLALQIVLRLLVRATGLSNTINSDLTLLVWFFITHVALAVVVQMVTAAVTAILVKQTGWAHGLFAAFVGGCIMTVEFLAVSLLFGGGLDPYYVWISASYIINIGALVSLFMVLGLLGIFNRVRTYLLKAQQPVAQPTTN